MALMAQQCGEEGIEVRSQRLQNADENWDDAMKKQVWPCKSDLENWRVKHYVTYVLFGLLLLGPLLFWSAVQQFYGVLASVPIENALI